jgi:hypothetical protein
MEPPLDRALDGKSALLRGLRPLSPQEALADPRVKAKAPREVLQRLQVAAAAAPTTAAEKCRQRLILAEVDVGALGLVRLVVRAGSPVCLLLWCALVRQGSGYARTCACIRRHTCKLDPQVHATGR